MALNRKNVPGTESEVSKIGYILSPMTRKPHVAERVKPRKKIIDDIFYLSHIGQM